MALKYHEIKTSRNDLKKILVIAERAQEELFTPLYEAGVLPAVSTGHIAMDLELTHANCPLDLDALREAKGFDFAHDLTGIYRHLNRQTGEMKDCFSPRYTCR